MSRKTIAFQIPRQEPVSRDLAAVPAPAVIEAEDWVSRTEPPVEAVREIPAGWRADTITLTISAEPDWFEAVWLGLVLPPAAFWLWGLSATHRSLRLFSR
jgi:hypothetical protein